MKLPQWTVTIKHLLFNFGSRLYCSISALAISHRGLLKLSTFRCIRHWGPIQMWFGWNSTVVQRIGQTRQYWTTAWKLQAQSLACVEMLRCLHAKCHMHIHENTIYVVNQKLISNIVHVHFRRGYWFGLNIFYFITHWKWIEQGNNATTFLGYWFVIE